MDILRLEGIKKNYDGQCVLSIDSLTIKKGTISGYLGTNGAGKSTTIKIIMGIIIPDQGEVIFQDRKIDYNHPAHKKYIGYCPDYPAVFEKLTVLEHLNFMAYLFGLEDLKEIEKRIQKYLSHFEIEKYKNTLIKNLSRGNKQKVSIVSSLIHEPELLVYDEPTLGLDPLSIKQFKAMLMEYTQNGGTVFLSSHSLNTIEEIADTVSIIHNGLIVKENIFVNEIRENLVSVEDYLISVVEGRE
ncbi:ABC transporter ATP-binding protein [Bacillus aquiflavi]|uniref:ABC transporter ATP-binding protein n=1 Tax=Bacillus aquiflavi TaxID=2672567 RepID=A0A6B3W3J2_9BACI|nr:ABC transporter ATP-binding protein [Bacillus aquiflavi]MBA4538707.1 ABC transporter ATP-binding protein [Bacillus aquiflavi]NEY83067.1 ABC transporter ATP-binding protein [Bacillus aquiflavi]UAC48030.1 ABC transporter ATP-binding protein [Bacillus aquiflavi]